MNRYLTPLLIAVSVSVGVTGQYLLKRGIDTVGRVESVGRMLSKDFIVSAATQWQIPVALVMYAGGAFMWMVVLSREDLSYAYPFLGLTYILVMTVSHFSLGENITWLRFAGTLLVSVGVVLIARS